MRSEAGTLSLGNYKYECTSKPFAANTPQESKLPKGSKGGKEKAQSKGVERREHGRDGVETRGEREAEGPERKVERGRVRGKGERRREKQREEGETRGQENQPTRARTAPTTRTYTVQS